VWQREVKEVSNFYGQEMNRTTYNLARMNMILHGVHYRKFDIKQEDTLEHPQHLDIYLLKPLSPIHHFRLNGVQTLYLQVMTVLANTEN
jgi:type I restriction-modification system DNA methylase subunit